MAQFISANSIINRTAIEVGLPSSPDPVSSGDDTYIQFTGLLNNCGQELVELNPWEILASQFSITTTDTGTYPLPNDFAYLTDQTGWNRSSLFPIYGPLSPQQWALCIAQSELVSVLQYGFRLIGNQMEIYPQLPGSGINLNFEYISRNWVETASASPVQQDTVISGSDIVKFEPILIIKMLKMKWLQAKGMPANDAAMEFDRLFNSRIGKDTGASVLSAGGNFGFPYLGQRNVPFTGIGF